MCQLVCPYKSHLIQLAEVVLTPPHRHQRASTTWMRTSASIANVAIARRLRAEVDETLQGRIPTTSVLPKLPYTRMVIDETLRLSPPAWITNRRAIESDTVSGYRIPADATLSISPYVTHRDPTIGRTLRASTPRGSPQNVRPGARTTRTSHLEADHANASARASR